MAKRTRKKSSNPPAKLKIASALRKLLETKDFHSITTAEIAKTSGANETLIYRYYGNKRGVLHDVLAGYLRETQSQILSNLKGVHGAVNKLRCIIESTIDIYDRNRVFAKIVLVEARNFPGFFESESYKLVRDYSKIYTDTISEGVESGELTADISVKAVRSAIIGIVEHMVMPYVIFGKEMQPDILTDRIFEIVTKGILVEETVS